MPQDLQSTLTAREVFDNAHDAAFLAGKFEVWDRAYKRLRATHSIREAALLALCDPNVDLRNAAERLRQGLR
jgi:hypothetical protein